MSARRKVVQLNREIGYSIDCFFSGIADAIEWLEPFLPWGVVFGIFLAVIGICFG